MEIHLLSVIKGAKDYFFMSTILALAKAKIWPVQAAVYKQEVVQRVILFAQTLFTRHANCAHLGELGMGSFKTNQVCKIANNCLDALVNFSIPYKGAWFG